MSLRGWPLVAWAALAVGAMCAAIVATQGFGEAGLHAVLLATAKTSALLFTSAFLASSLRTLWRKPWTAWLLRNRRYVGVSFAASHTWHLAAIVAYGRVSPEPYEGTVVALGGIAYGFVAAMAGTSFDRAVRWLGPGRWRRLHVTGLYYIWLIFAFTYLGGVLEAADAAGRIVPGLFLGGLVAALITRLGLRRRSRRTTQNGVVG